MTGLTSLSFVSFCIRTGWTWIWRSLNAFNWLLDLLPRKLLSSSDGNFKGVFSFCPGSKLSQDTARNRGRSPHSLNSGLHGTLWSLISGTGIFNFESIFPIPGPGRWVLKGTSFSFPFLRNDFPSSFSQTFTQVLRDVLPPSPAEGENLGKVSICLRGSKFSFWSESFSLEFSKPAERGTNLPWEIFLWSFCLRSINPFAAFWKYRDTHETENQVQIPFFPCPRTDFIVKTISFSVTFAFEYVLLPKK